MSPHLFSPRLIDMCFVWYVHEREERVTGTGVPAREIDIGQWSRTSSEGPGKEEYAGDERASRTTMLPSYAGRRLSSSKGPEMVIALVVVAG
jgi:hypothetical protein